MSNNDFEKVEKHQDEPDEYVTINTNGQAYFSKPLGQRFFAGVDEVALRVSRTTGEIAVILDPDDDEDTYSVWRPSSGSSGVTVNTRRACRAVGLGLTDKIRVTAEEQDDTLVLDVSKYADTR